MSRTAFWLSFLVSVFVSAPGVLAQVAVANPHGTLPEGIDCSACHTAQGWSVLRDPLGFHHGDKSGFLLSGAHQRARCAACHLELRFDGPALTMEDCSSCHADVHQGQLVQACTACHTTNSFHDVNGELMHARTSFPLTGAHLQVTCESCHRDDRGGAFSPLDTDCSSCHLPAYQAARTVDHVGSGYPTDCTQCHSTLAWGDTPSFDHGAVSGGFVLLGAHNQLRCASCHVVPGMALVHPAADQNDCVACHRADYDREHGGGFPTTCVTCHTVDSWEGADFDHALTGFALVEPHGSLECSSCHVGADRALKFPVPSSQNDCVACHQADYDKEHGGLGFPTTCLSCHKSNSWGGASFNHAATAFPLVGAHARTVCSDCHGPPAHLSALFQGGGSCTACHQSDYDRAHQGSGFPTTCLNCHDQATWDGAVFDHAGSTGFALVESHAAAPCTSCHTLPDYGLKFSKPAGQNDCVACHQTEYDANHSGSGFPTTCLNCHGQSTWQGAVFDHGNATGFALAGPHAPLECTSCHAVPGYALLFPQPANADDCVACHQGDYDANHAGSSFPTTCLSCHQRDTWSGATVDHVTIGNGFALLGAHAVTTCAACHAIPGYALRFPKPSGQNDCAACHQVDYLTAHGASGYPTDCAACHTVNAWKPSTFDHDAQYFPIYSGEHREAWSNCNQCHTSPSDLRVFSCLTCHEHSKAEMDDKHRGRQGYVYQSSACLSCHPRGKAD